MRSAPGEHLAPRVGQHVAIAAAVEQARAEPLLERFHATQHGGVADAERDARRSDGSGAGKCEEVSDVVPVHEERLDTTHRADDVAVRAVRIAVIPAAMASLLPPRAAVLLLVTLASCGGDGPAPGRRRRRAVRHGR
jgi:hypothetical protein